MTARAYLTAGVATLGVGAMALSAVQPMPSQSAPLQQRVVSDMAVGLAAAVDPIQAWVNVFENSAANLGILAEFYLQKPLPLLQTVAANAQTYADELANGQGDLIGGQIWNNVQTFFQAPYDPGAMQTWPPAGGCSGEPCPVSQGWPFEKDGKLPTASGTIPAANPNYPDNATWSPQDLELAAAQLLAGVVEGGIAAFAGITGLPEDEAEALWVTISDNQMLLDQFWTPAVGQLMGLLGMGISPLVQLTRSFAAVGAAFQAGEALDAVYELINIPANMTNAFLNGLDTPLDLTGVISNFFTLPGNTHLGLQLGGLLNTMPYNGSLRDPDNPPTEYSTGTLWDNLSVISTDIKFVQDQNPYGLKNGWAGSVVGLGQYLSDQLLVTPPDPEEVAAASAAVPAPAAAVAEESVPAISEEDLAESAPAVEDNAKAESASAPKAAAATGDDSDGNTGRAARSGGRGAR